MWKDSVPLAQEATPLWGGERYGHDKLRIAYVADLPTPGPHLLHLTVPRGASLYSFTFG